MPDWVGFAAFTLSGVGALTCAVWIFLHSRFDRHPLLAITLAAYGLVYGVVPAILQPDETYRAAFTDGVTSGMYATAGTAAVLGLGGLVFGWLMLERLSPRPLAGRLTLTDREAVQIAVLCGVVALGGFVLVAMASAGGVDLFLAGGRFDHRQGGNSILAVAGTHLLRAAMVPAFVLTNSKARRLRRVGMVYALIAGTLIYLAFNGSRATAMGVIGAAFVGAMWSRDPRPRSAVTRPTRRAFRQVATMALVGPLLVLLIAVAYDARSSLYHEGPSALQESLLDADLELVLQNESVNYSDMLYFVVDAVPRDQDWMWLYPLRRVVFFYVPFGDWKPPDPLRLIGDLIPGTSSTAVMPPTLPGEAYAVAGGLLGVVPWMGLYGVLGAWFERNAQRSRTIRILLGSTLFELVLVGMRGQFYSVVFRVATLTVVVMAVDRLVQRWRGRPADVTPRQPVSGSV